MGSTTHPQDQPRVKVGIGVFILSHSSTDPSKSKFIFGHRKGSHGSGTWALPGGHLEHGESFEDCARREVFEETGLEITDVSFFTAVNSLIPPAASDGKVGVQHYVTVFMISRRVDEEAEPMLLEPEKCEGWKWIEWDEMVDWYRQGQDEQNNEEQNQRLLFTPMISLVEQRPGVVPVLLPS